MNNIKILKFGGSLKVKNKKLRVGILGATGMVGQRFILLLENHPWFEVAILAASSRSACKTYVEAVSGRWAMKTPIPESVKDMELKAIEEDFDEIVKNSDLVFSAVDMDKEKIKEIEEKYAAAGVAVISNNSAHRWTEDVPMVIPEINSEHLSIIDIQRKNRGWKTGLIAVKPNCSLQSYLPVIYALNKFKPKAVSVTILQAISGAGKTFESWPEMKDNCIPFIKGEEEKTEQEPMKIFGSIKNGKLEIASELIISATCIRVAVMDGHMASVTVTFEKKPSLEQIIDTIENFQNPLSELNLPSAPKKFIKYFTEDNRPQTRLDRDYENGMGITCGRFREDSSGDPRLGGASHRNGGASWKFVALSHNTIRGAAGGAILTAELLYKKGYLGSQTSIRSKVQVKNPEH